LPAGYILCVRLELFYKIKKPSKEEPGEYDEENLTYLIDNSIYPKFNEKLGDIQELKKQYILANCGGFIKGYMLIYIVVEDSEKDICSDKQKLYINNFGVKESEVDVNFFGSVESYDATKGIFIMNYVVKEYIQTRVKDKNYIYLYHLIELRDKSVSSFIQDWSKCIKNTVIVNISLNDDESKKAFKDPKRVKGLCEHFGEVDTVKGNKCQMLIIMEDFTGIRLYNDYSNLKLNVRVYSMMQEHEIVDSIKLTFESDEEKIFHAYYTKKQPSEYVRIH
jgi:hypothetical protein